MVNKFVISAFKKVWLGNLGFLSSPWGEVAVSAPGEGRLATTTLFKLGTTNKQKRRTDLMVRPAPILTPLSSIPIGECPFPQV